MKIKTLLIVSFVLCISSGIFAQSISIGPQLGFVKSTDADNASLMPGVAVRLNLLSFGLEGAIYYKSEDFQSGSVNTKGYPINITLLWKFMPLLHAEGGIGWYNTKIDGSLNNVKSEINNNNAGYHLGAGIDLPLSGVILTVDIRYVFLDISSQYNFKSNFSVVMIGLSFPL